MYKVNDKEYECSIAVTLDIFNDKWKLFIIWHLLSGDKRFKELDEILAGGISQKTLTVKLKELEAKQIVNREVFAQVPPKVVYSLTPSGQRLRTLLREMFDWGIGYVEEHGEVTEDHHCCEVDVSQKIAKN